MLTRTCKIIVTKDKKGRRKFIRIPKRIVKTIEGIKCYYYLKFTEKDKR